MLAKERKDDPGRAGECCLHRAGCNHDTLSQRQRCCRISSCSHSPSRYGKVEEDKEDRLPSPPPRGQSSVQTVQALKMKIEAGTPEMRRKIQSNKKGESRSTPLRNGVKSRAETSSSRDNAMTSRGDLSRSRGDLRNSRGDLVTSLENVMTSRGDLSRSRGDLRNSRGDLVTLVTSLENVMTSQSDFSRPRGDLRNSRGDLVTSRENLMTSRDDLRNSRGALVTSRDYMTTSLGDSVTSRGDLINSRGDLRLSREDVMKSRDVSTAAQASSPNMSLRSEGSGRSLHKNHDEPPFARTGPPLRMPSFTDTARTPISRTSGRQFVPGNVPMTADHDIDYMKEELVSRLIKEKEELLKLRKKKESEREKMVELRRELQCRNIDETFETTPEPRQRLPELDRLNYVVQETPLKSDSSSNPSQSPDSCGFSPRYRLRDTDLKSEAANRILFSEAHQRRPAPKSSNFDSVEKHVPTEKHIPIVNKVSSPVKTNPVSSVKTTPVSSVKTTPVSSVQLSGFHGRRPASTLAKSVEKLNEVPTTPTRRVTVASAPCPTELASLSQHRPRNYEPLSMRTTPLRPQVNGIRTDTPSSLQNPDGKSNFTAIGSQNSLPNPARGFTPIQSASSASKVNSSGAPADTARFSHKLGLNHSVEESERFKTLPPELNSPFNERAVDCPASEDSSRKKLSLERGVKLSNQGYDVIRTVVRTEGEEGDNEINPALLHPFRRRSRKSREASKEANKDKCNTQ